MEADDCQFSQSNRHFTISTRQTEYHEALPSLVNDDVRCDCMFADDGSASWYSVCQVLMMEWRFNCENCHHLTVVGLHDAGPWWSCCDSNWKDWCSSGYPARCFVFRSQCWDWLAWCQCAATEWDAKLHMKRLSQCGLYKLRKTGNMKLGCFRVFCFCLHAWKISELCFCARACETSCEIFAFQLVNS